MAFGSNQCWRAFLIFDGSFFESHEWRNGVSKLLLGIAVALEVIAVIVFESGQHRNIDNPIVERSTAAIGLAISSGIAAAGFALAGGFCFLGSGVVAGLQARRRTTDV